MSAAEKLRALLIEADENDDVPLPIPQIVAVVEWMQNYADSEDWHAYVGTEGGRMDEEADALLAALDEALP